jgi:hypothetical protein
MEVKFFSSFGQLRGNRTIIKGLGKKRFSHLKSRGPWVRVGSIPTVGTIFPPMMKLPPSLNPLSSNEIPVTSFNPRPQSRQEKKNIEFDFKLEQSYIVRAEILSIAGQVQLASGDIGEEPGICLAGVGLIRRGSIKPSLRR